LHARNKRIRPLLDDKQLLSWNALMNTACSKAFAATGIEAYRTMAVANMNFLLKAFSAEKGLLYHSFKNEKAQIHAFLDDYAFLIQALLQLQEITSDTSWLKLASNYAQTVQNLFAEPETGFFYYTAAGEKDIIVRKKEVYDGATPSGNAVMAVNLYYLGIVFDKKEWQQKSVRMTGALQQAITRYPVSFGVWVGHLYNLLKGYMEIAVVGEGFEKGRDHINAVFHPNKIIQAATVAHDEFPILAGKTTSMKTPIFFLCKNYTCRAPIAEIPEFISILAAQ
jgi:uncharacterized protein YyaL (SSP411 family)